MPNIVLLRPIGSVAPLKSPLRSQSGLYRRFHLQRSTSGGEGRWYVPYVVMSFRNFTTGDSLSFSGKYVELVSGERLHYVEHQHCGQ